MSYLRSLLILAALLVGTAVQAAPDTAVLVGHSATLSVTANGSAPFSYQWIKDSSNISGATGSTYVIASFSAAYTGVYSVQVSNSAGSTLSDTVNLIIQNIAPTITTQPASQNVALGKTFAFAVIATGTPAPTYQWTLNRAAIPGATASSYSGTASTSGSYQVVVTNAAGSVTSVAATLTVTTPPTSATLKVIVQ